jgi:hypothetical protein
MPCVGVSVKLFLGVPILFPVCYDTWCGVVQAALDSNNPSGVFAGMGIPPMEYGKIITMIYLKVGVQNNIGVRRCISSGPPLDSAAEPRCPSRTSSRYSLRAPRFSPDFTHLAWFPPATSSLS